MRCETFSSLQDENSAFDDHDLPFEEDGRRLIKEKGT